MKSSIVQSDKSGLCQIHQKVQHIEDMAVQQRGQTNKILMLSSVLIQQYYMALMWHFDRQEHIV